MSIPAHQILQPRLLRFGRGEALASVPVIAAMGRRVLLVHGASPVRAAPIRAALVAAGCEVSPVDCPCEPTLDMLTRALGLPAPQVVVAVGGGAVLDFGKALAALLPVPGCDPLDHLEVVGRALPLVATPLPLVAIPTTAGTGAEATRNAVISVPQERRKVSLRDDRMVPALAVVDPALTDGSPVGRTLASGLDAVTQVIEPYLSRRAVPFSDALCRDAIARGFDALARLMRGEDPGARDAMCHVSYVSGVALSNAGLGAVHGLAGVLGGETGAAHGDICGRLLPHVLLANAARATGDTAARIAEIDAACRGALGVGLTGLADWTHDHGLPSGPALAPARRRAVAQASAASSSMKPNPVALDTDALDQILRSAGW